MNKTLLIIGVLLSIVAFFVFVYEPCQEPSEIEVQVAQLKCAMDLVNSENFREVVCRGLSREPVCSLSEEDRPAIMQIINAKINECVLVYMSSNNYCTDSIKELKAVE